MGIAGTATGEGYWLVGSDGGIFAFGTAQYAGSLPADGVSVSDVVGITESGTGTDGYLLVGSDGACSPSGRRVPRL